jgi:hypothetical protein
LKVEGLEWGASDDEEDEDEGEDSEEEAVPRVLVTP